MTYTQITNSPKETKKIAAGLLKKLNSNRILLLHGNLGSGKTTFIQGIARELGITKKIISPTFIIMRSYKIPPNKSSLPIHNFYHLDLFRINELSQIYDIGIMDLIKNPLNLFAIEWPEKINPYLPENKINIYFEYQDENKRQITIDNFVL